MNTGRSRTRSESKPSRGFLLLGVTGGIGSGKTAVCREFQKLGRTVLAADRIARDLTETDDDVRALIRKNFGKGVFSLDGVLNRKALADIVFADTKSRTLLNAIIHPRVFRRIDEILKTLPIETKAPYTVVEAALIFESGMEKQLDYVLVVHAPLETRILRVISRDGCTREDVESRISSQMSAEKKLDLADFTMDNRGKEEEISSKTAFFDRLLVSLAR